jgi:hypothetical protein
MTVEHNKRGGKGSCSREDAPQEASAKTQATQLSTTDERTKNLNEPSSARGDTIRPVFMNHHESIAAIGFVSKKCRCFLEVAPSSMY